MADNAPPGILGNGLTRVLAPEGVTVLQDAQAGADEGRAMLQIVHDIAPKARSATVDSKFDPDTRRHFFGTSAAAPHAVANAR